MTTETHFGKFTGLTFAAVAGMAAVSTAFVANTEAMAAEMKPHVAVYEMSAQTISEEAIKDVRGFMRYDLRETCDSWRLSMSSQIVFRYKNGSTEPAKWEFVSSESKNGRRFQYKSKEYNNGLLYGNVQGVAVMGSRARASKAVFVRPRPKAVRLPQGTKLPTQHLAAVIDNFGEKKLRVSDLVFDGTTNGKVFKVDTTINPVGRGATHAIPAETGKGLSPAPVWDVRMAYVPANQTPADQTKAAAKPEFTMTIRYRRDGIATRILQDFGGVVLKADLKQLEVYESPSAACAVETTQVRDIKLADAPNG